jgi:CheY-like chemotaxis protein
VTARGTSITSRLLTFARRGELREELVDCTELLNGLGEVFKYTLGSAIRVDVSIALDLPLIFVDKGQLETVLVNLATNARDALPKGGVLSIGATVDGPTPERTLPDTLSPGRYIRLTVADNGVGMNQATLRRVLEPFFSTKEPGQGTGLGLPMAKGFAEQSGGGLAIESTLGRGTTVDIWLPVAKPGPGQTECGDLSTRPPRQRGRRILLVDDEEQVRHTLSEALETVGYIVLRAADGVEALGLLNRDGPIDVLVTDLSMPRMDGLETIRTAHHIHPKLPTILLTGYAGVGAQLALGEAVRGPFTLLRKPVTTDRLIDCVEAYFATSPQTR